MNNIHTINRRIANGFHAALHAFVSVTNGVPAMPAQGFRPEMDALCSNYWNRIYIIQSEVSRWE